MRHRILECIKQNDTQFIVNKNNKGQLNETLKVKILSCLEKKKRNGSKYIGVNNEKGCIVTGINDTNNVFLEIAGRGQLTITSLQNILETKAYKNLANVNSMNSRFKEFIKKLHRVATRRLDNYLP